MSKKIQTPLGKSRNLPCHCGSGIKLKKCCHSPELVNEFNDEQRKLREAKLAKLREERSKRKGGNPSLNLTSLCASVLGGWRL